MNFDIEFLVKWGIIFVLVAFVLVLPLAIREDIQWHKWADEHCKIVGEMDGDVFPTVGISGNGQMTTEVGFTSDKTGYQCDDGKTYWK